MRTGRRLGPSPKSKRPEGTRNPKSKIPQRQRSSRADRDVRAGARQARLWVVGAVAATSLAVVLGGLGWQAYRRAAAQRVAAGGLGSPKDEREAGLLRAVQARPADARLHRDLGAYYLERRRPFEAL